MSVEGSRDELPGPYVRMDADVERTWMYSQRVLEDCTG